MTIQIPIVLWTLICFALLYAVLKYLLFGPVLSLMERRQQKIDKSHEAVREAEQRDRQAAAEAENRRVALLERRQEDVKLEAEKIASEGKNLLEQARKERIETVERYRSEMAAAYQTDAEAARLGVGTAAASFLDGLYAE